MLGVCVGQIDVCALRHHRERDAAGAGVARPDHDRDQQHDAAAGEDLRRRGHRADPVPARPTPSARRATPTRRASTRTRTGLTLPFVAGPTSRYGRRRDSCTTAPSSRYNGASLTEIVYERSYAVRVANRYDHGVVTAIGPASRAAMTVTLIPICSRSRLTRIDCAVVDTSDVARSIATP